MYHPITKSSYSKHLKGPYDYLQIVKRGDFFNLKIYYNILMCIGTVKSKDQRQQISNSLGAKTKLRRHGTPIELQMVVAFALMTKNNLNVNNFGFKNDASTH